MDDFIGFGIVIIGAIVLLSLFAFTAPWILLYRIADSGIEILLLRKFVRKRVPFDNITDIETISTAEAMFPWDLRALRTFKGANRLTGPFVLIRQKKSIFRRYVLISPADPEEFIRAIRKCIKSTDV